MRENFSSIHYHTEYIEFGRIVLEPFKNIVSSYFGLNEDGKTLMDYNNELGFYQEEESAKEAVVEDKPVLKDKRFLTIEKLLRRMLETIKTDKKVKQDLRENLSYILNRSIYALNYQDIELISPLITIFDIMSKKVKTIAWDYNDLKVEIKKFYDDKEDVYNEDDLVDGKELEDYMNEAQKILDEEDDD